MKTCVCAAVLSETTFDCGFSGVGGVVALVLLNYFTVAAGVTAVFSILKIAFTAAA